MGESLINYWGAHQFRGYSAGSSPKGKVHPLTLEVLTDMQLATDGLRSRSWIEFAAPGARPLDFVFTVCDNAAREVPPRWPALSRLNLQAWANAIGNAKADDAYSV